MSLERPIPVDPQITIETDIVAIGGEITAAALWDSYRRGTFPMTVNAEIDGEYPVDVNAWFAPAQRAVLRYPGMSPSRSLRRSMRGFEFSFDTAFEAVLDGCGDPNRPNGWINDEYRRAYVELHRQRVAHSVEVWASGRLAGGLLGVELGGLFCADSKFHRVADASKAAVAALSMRLFAGEHGSQRLIDAQWLTPHLSSLGFTEMPRAEYRATLPKLLELPPELGARQPGSTTS